MLHELDDSVSLAKTTMEAVRKRPQRAKAAKKRQQQESKDVAASLIDGEENAVVQAAIAELDAIQEPQTTDREIRRNEDDLMALLQGGERQQEPLVVEGAGSQPPDKDNDNDQGGTGDYEINTQEAIQTNTSEKVPVVPVVVNGVTAPSAPAFEEEEGLATPPEQIPLQPKPNAPPPSPPTRTTMPRAFHEITVPVSAGIDAVPSAPPGFEDDSVEVADHSSTTPSAPSLSPTASKKLHRVVASPRKPEKMNPVVRMPAKDATAVTVEETTTETKETIAGYEQLLKKKHIRVKLEPFINYEMNLMRTEASQKRQEMKMRHIETNKGELYARVERYLFSEYILHNAASTMDEYKKKIDVLVKKGTSG
eukprot:jgi/Phyca11/17862/fgenesh1_pg.PHYCAscaffold_31_\